MLIESRLPKQLWTYAVQNAAVVRSRCFNKHTKQTPIQALTGRRPNLSHKKKQKFGSECFTLNSDKRKLDPQCEKCVFIGYDKNSPAYIVYFPNTKKVQKHRVVKFVTKTGVEQQTQTNLTPVDDFVQYKSRSPDHVSHYKPEVSHHQPQPVEVKCEPEPRCYPSRERRMPDRYTDYRMSKYVSDEDTDQVQSNIDYCYRVMCTRIRGLMQKATQENLILHQMDVKTAYLNAPIN